MFGVVRDDQVRLWVCGFPLEEEGMQDALRACSISI